MRTRLSLDTSPEFERRQVEAWRQMSAADKAAMVTGLTRAACTMAAAGVRQRHPDASPREHFLRLAVILLGADLARSGVPRFGSGDLPVTGAIDPIETALLVSRLLDELHILHTIGGSIASSFAGEPRSTLDIDIVAALDEGHVEALVAALSPQFYVDADALRRAIRMRSSTNLIHQRTQLKVDLFVAGDAPGCRPARPPPARRPRRRALPFRAPARGHPAAEAALVSPRRRGLGPPVAGRRGHRPGSSRRAGPRVPPRQRRSPGRLDLLERALEEAPSRS